MTGIQAAGWAVAIYLLASLIVGLALGIPALVWFRRQWRQVEAEQERIEAGIAERRARILSGARNPGTRLRP